MTDVIICNMIGEIIFVILVILFLISLFAFIRTKNQKIKKSSGIWAIVSFILLVIILLSQPNTLNCLGF